MSSRLAQALAPYALPVDLPAARRALAHAHDAVAILALYRHYFPSPWAVSGASRIRGPIDAYSEAEWEFFQLLNAQLFPIALDAMEDAANDRGARALAVPMDPWAFDTETLVESRLGWQLLAYVSDHPLAGVADLAGTPWAAVLATLDGPPVALAWDRLVVACAAAAPPLGLLPEAVAVLDQATGNAWLDFDDETNPWAYVDLTIRTIDAAAAEARAATALLTSLDPLLDWLEADPAHLQEVCDLWIQNLSRPAPPRTMRAS